MAKKFGKCTGGFSFLELLVSMGIFAVITTAVVVNFRSGQHSNELRLAAQQLASYLQSLYTQAQVGTDKEFHLDVFKLTLPPNILVSQPQNLTVKFQSPKPTVLINGGAQEAEAKIVLTHTKTQQTKTIVIKRVSGRINVE